MLRQSLIRSISNLISKSKHHLSRLSMVDKPDGNIILVISPHPDDDVIGCGGTIRLHVLSGHTVFVAYLTDGEGGIKDGKNNGVELRKLEAIKSTTMLGVDESNLFFFHLTDGHLINQTEVNYDFRNLVSFIKPDVIYLPSFLETHQDHYAANLFLQNNLISSVTIGAYEVWTPLIPNRLVNISSVIEEKKKSILAHTSQMNELDYADAAVSINRYRAAMYSNKSQYAEAFIYCKSTEYFHLMNSCRQ